MEQISYLPIIIIIINDYIENGWDVLRCLLINHIHRWWTVHWWTCLKKSAPWAIPPLPFYIQLGDYLEIVMIPTHKPHIFFMVTIICISKMYTVIKYPQPFYDTIWRLPWKKFEIPIHKPYIFLVDGHEIMHWLTYQTSAQEVTPSHCTNYLENSIFLYFSMHTERLFYVPFLG